MGRASHDVNNYPTLIAVSSVDGATPIELYADPTTHELLVQGTISGSVTITATDLDIRNLSQTQDSVLIYGSDDGGTTKRVIKTDSGGAIQVDLEVASVTITGDALTALQNIDTDTTTIISHLDGVEGLLTDIEADTDTLAVVGGGTEATALRVTIATDSTGVLSVDDNGSSLTVDNAGLTELAAAINASSQMDVNIAASNATVTVSATDLDIRDLTATDVVTANLSATDNAVLDAIEADTTTIAGDTTAIQTAVEIMDDWDETNRAAVNTIAGQVGVAAGAGTVDALTQRIIKANRAGKTILSTGGTAGSSGNNTLIAAGTNRLKVFAFSLSTVSTTAVTCIFQSGASGTELWRVILQTPASVAGGANLSVTPPAWLFATASATLLNLNLSAAVTVHWSCSYWDES